MNQNDRIVRIARDLRELVKNDPSKTHLEAYKQVAHALAPILYELSDKGVIGTDVGLELPAYVELKISGASVAEQYGDSVDIGLEQYKSSGSEAKA